MATWLRGISRLVLYFRALGRRGATTEARVPWTLARPMRLSIGWICTCDIVQVYHARSSLETLFSDIVSAALSVVC